MLSQLISLIFPKKCLLCSKIVGDYGALCVECWSGIEFIQNPCCNRCGFPFKFDIEDDLLCGHCLKTLPHFDRAFSLFKYDEHSKKLVHKFKYDDKTYLSKHFAKWIFSRLDADKTIEYEYITSVPLHRKRLRQRLYNQSSLIAKDLAKISSAKFIPDILLKVRHDTPQSKLSKNARQKNVKSSFIINAKYASLIQGNRLLLIDDVYTTGATLNECSKILKAGKCSAVYAVTVART